MNTPETTTLLGLCTMHCTFTSYKMKWGHLPGMKQAISKNISLYVKSLWHSVTLDWVSNLQVHGAVLQFLSATWGEYAKGMSLPNNWVKQGHTPEIPDYCPAKGNGQDRYVGVTVGLVGNHRMQI